MATSYSPSGPLPAMTWNGVPVPFERVDAAPMTALSIEALDQIADAVAIELQCGGGLVEAFNGRVAVAVEAVGFSTTEIEGAIRRGWKRGALPADLPIVARPFSDPPPRAERKPRELAAGQVWEIEWSSLGLRRYTLIAPRGNGVDWSYEESAIASVGGLELRGGMRDCPSRYLGTREEVAAREQAAETGKRAAEQLRHGSPSVRADLNACASAILAQLPPGTAAVEIERTDSDGVFLVSARGCSAADVKRAIVATPGLPVVLSFLPKPTPGRADRPREVKGLVYGHGPDPIGRVPESVARAFQAHEDRREACAEALRLAPDQPFLDLSGGAWLDTLAAEISGGVVKRKTGETDEALRARLRAWTAGERSTPPPWTVADARREIDRVLAAEERRGVPFLRAKRAALATLSSDLPGRNPAPVAKVIHGTLAAIEAYEAARPGERRIPEGRTGELYVLAARAYCASTGEDVRHPPVVVYGAIDRYERERAR